MCLDNVLKRKEFLERIKNQPHKKIETHKRNSKLKVGWKAVVIRDEKVSATHYYVNKKYYSTGKWLNEKNFRRDAYNNETNIRIAYNTFYKIGFHILATHTDAERYAMAVQLRFRRIRLVKVYYKKAVAYGKDSGCYTVIAKEMYIPRQTPLTCLGNKCKKRLR